MDIRLQKALAAAGVASRREAERIIADGRVAVDGQIVTQLGTKVDPDLVQITVDGKPIDLHPKLVYILLNKPRGYASTRRDPHAPRMITDLVKDIDANLYPVGRLDVDTEGAIILTNDGDFAFKMTHPKHHVSKTYRAEAHGLISQEAVKELQNGVLLEDGLTSPAKARVVALNTVRRTSVIEIILTEGRKRQVRRMLEAIGHPVYRLSRTKFGNLTPDKLKPGEWRFLTPDEVESLLALAS